MPPTERVSFLAKQVLGPGDIERLVARLAHEVNDRYEADLEGPLDIKPDTLAIVGIRTGGAHLAERLADGVEKLRGERPPVGVLDITLYRDDVLTGANPVPQLRGTSIPFALHGRYVVLVDDVLFTGRTVRAALDALLDLGRPGCVRLAVLVDRGLRELPVSADFVGRELETRLSDHVKVELTEEGADKDGVIMELARDRRDGEVE